MRFSTEKMKETLKGFLFALFLLAPFAVGVFEGYLIAKPAGAIWGAETVFSSRIMEVFLAMIVNVFLTIALLAMLMSFGGFGRIQYVGAEAAMLAIIIGSVFIIGTSTIGLCLSWAFF